MVALDRNNTGNGGSDVGFSLENVVDDYKWTFRTYLPSEGFAASKIGTGGTEFEVGNIGTGLSTTVVKMGGKVVFKNGNLVDSSGAKITSLISDQGKMLTRMEADAKVKDAEIIAMKSDAKSMQAKLQSQDLKIAQLETMEQKVAMMESILTNLALNTSDTDKSKVSINFK